MVARSFCDTTACGNLLTCLRVFLIPERRGTGVGSSSWKTAHLWAATADSSGVRPKECGVELLPVADPFPRGDVGLHRGQCGDVAPRTAGDFFDDPAIDAEVSLPGVGQGAVEVPEHGFERVIREHGDIMPWSILVCCDAGPFAMNSELVEKVRDHLGAAVEVVHDEHLVGTVDAALGDIDAE